jgi:hypothetical protein
MTSSLNAHAEKVELEEGSFKIDWTQQAKQITSILT